MREIKFRAWDGRQKRFGYFHVSENRITWPSFDYLERTTLDDESESVRFPDIEGFQQWTGLLDKNGKEIYEGDIVEYEFGYENNIAEPVIFKGRSFQLSSGNNYMPEEVEVIGNIWENPNPELINA